MSEAAAVWGALRKGFRGQGDWTRVENSAGPGTPDVNYAWADPHDPHAPHIVYEGWIELKEIPSLPALSKRNTEPVKVKHFRPAQRVWIERRARARGNVWILLRVVRPEWWFFFPGFMQRIVGREPIHQLVRGSAISWEGPFNADRLKEPLRYGSEFQRSLLPNPDRIRPLSAIDTGDGEVADAD